MRTPAIVVAVDDTPAVQAALEFAVREAVTRAGTITVVTASDWGGTREGLAGAWTPLEARDRAQRIQDRAIAKTLRGLLHAPVMSRRVVEGDAAHVLVRAAKDGDYLVVGTGHKGRFRRAFLGSVASTASNTPTVPWSSSRHPPNARRREGNARGWWPTP